jgi:hypothetical protein
MGKESRKEGSCRWLGFPLAFIDFADECCFAAKKKRKRRRIGGYLLLELKLKKKRKLFDDAY